MRKNKLDKNEQEQLLANPTNSDAPFSSKDQELLDQLMLNFQQMDQMIPHSTPPQVVHLEQLIMEQKLAIRKRNRLELLCFFLVALVLIGGNTLLVMTNWTVFGIFQGVTLIAALGILYGSFVRRKKNGDARHAK